MPNITLSLPKDVYQIVKTHKEVRWSEIARKAIEEYAKKLALLDREMKTYSYNVKLKLNGSEVEKLIAEEDLKQALF